MGRSKPRLLTTNNHVVAVLDQLDQPTLETKERNTDAKRTPTSDQAVPDSVSVVVLDVVPDAVAQPDSIFSRENWFSPSEDLSLATQEFSSVTVLSSRVHSFRRMSTFFTHPC